MMPSLFIAHGAPLLAIEDNQYTQFLEELGRTLPRPQAIVLFSAHWEANTQQVSDVDEYSTIHDFGGFPRALFEIEYPAKGDHELSKDIQELFSAHSISYNVHPERGLDHGAWVVLKMLYPEADIPVISMSVNPRLTPAEQYEIGKALSSLRERDVLVIGSGGTVHNLGILSMHDDSDTVDEWALEFDAWLEQHVNGWNLPTLFDYEDKAPAASMAVPPYGNEHFIPIFYAMGAADDVKEAKLLHRSYRYRNLSHSVWQFG
ncbi:dioxygenase family protein [Alteribacillus iranensis]|uniref:4,5-DOPA dioxygenase extradiol n=1 Tax=Alteribacillus iranensis TaxID=930128 RepID=A0A1I2B572_9BACI|nr:class III extradiol ring-cleavage dioxygenase [Alteribacillus iranensis]SFE51199.1 4,5-DOPA dioxygenase extradiol [Alteribacillus iranensis]